VFDVGGVGPIAAYLGQLGWSVFESKVDLRGQLPFENESFDLVLCLETIEHIKDLDSARIEDLEAFNYSGMRNLLRELGRVARPSAPIIVTTPNACSFHTLNKWLRGEVLLMDPGHVRELTPLELERIAAECGLEARSITLIDSWPESPPVSSALKQALAAALEPTLGHDHRDNIVAVLSSKP
jgi:SAM-dependent methyltransferase